MADLPTLVFMRHGETDWNRTGRLQGQQDIPLNELGRSQAKRNGDAIVARFPDIATFDFVASPLSRTRETMEIARAAMGLPPEDYRIDPRLKELTFGDWEGFTNDEIRESHPDAAEQRETEKWRFVPPNGESYALLADRVAPWLAELDRPTMVVAHGGIARVMRIHLNGEEPLAAVSADIPQDRVFVWRDGGMEEV